MVFASIAQIAATVSDSLTSAQQTGLEEPARLCDILASMKYITFFIVGAVGLVGVILAGIGALGFTLFYLVSKKDGKKKGRMGRFALYSAGLFILVPVALFVLVLAIEIVFMVFSGNKCTV